MEAENKWKTTKDEIPPNPNITTAEQLIDTLTKTVDKLNVEINKLEQRLEEDKKG